MELKYQKWYTSNTVGSSVYYQLTYHSTLNKNIHAHELNFSYLVLTPYNQERECSNEQTFAKTFPISLHT
jgi:hypothetical protein